MIRVAVGRGGRTASCATPFGSYTLRTRHLLTTWQPGPTQPNGWAGAMMGR